MVLTEVVPTSSHLSLPMRTSLHRRPTCLTRDIHHPIELPSCVPASLKQILPGSGILTGFPSTTTFVLALGADSPEADWPCPGNLEFSADGVLTRLFVTNAGRVSSDISSLGYP